MGRGELGVVASRGWRNSDTGRESPHTNGVRERASGSLRCEHLYREEITDGVMLVDQSEHDRQIFNTIRPHEALDMGRPTDVYLTAVPSCEDPETEPESWRGTVLSARSCVACLLLHFVASGVDDRVGAETVCPSGPPRSRLDDLMAMSLTAAGCIRCRRPTGRRSAR